MRIAGELANSIAAPNPCKARAAINAIALGAMEQSSEPAMKTTKPATYTGLWPLMSPNRPKLSRMPLTSSRYMVTTHWTVAISAPKSLRITGKTVLTTLPSSADMNVPTPTASRMVQRIPAAGSGAVRAVILAKTERLSSGGTGECIRGRRAHGGRRSLPALPAAPESRAVR